MGTKPFNQVQALHPGRSLQVLNHTHNTTCDMGLLVPIFWDEVYPGDVYKMAHDVVVRFQPLIAPIMHEVNVYIHDWYVPTRILWEKFEKFISGGIDGEYKAEIPLAPGNNFAVGSLADYMGVPVNVTIPEKSRPIALPFRAYTLIFQDNYRDQNLQPIIYDSERGDSLAALDTMELYRRNWEKDYFTSALPFRERGNSPSLPITGSITWPDPTYIPAQLIQWNGGNNTIVAADWYREYAGVSAQTRPQLVNPLGNYGPNDGGYSIDNLRNPPQNIANVLNNHDISGLKLDADVFDFRVAFATHRFMERNARGGVRFTEFIQNNFGQKVHDYRVQRPEFIGGMKSPVIVSEVLQTSSTDSTTPQGNMAGHGITADRGYTGKYRVYEHGYIISLLSIMPRTMYQQGISRKLTRRDKFDFLTPQFMNLGEQAIFRKEVYIGDGKEEEIFGYIGQYDEMRHINNRVSAEMRTDFNHWHFGRIFNSATPPQLNEDFIKCNPEKRPFAVQLQNKHSCIVQVRNRIKAVRPLTAVANPGLIDHI